MGWVMQKTSSMFLIFRRVLVRFYLCIETFSPFLGMGLVTRELWQGIWCAPQNLRGFLPAFEINKRTDQLSLWAGEQFNYLVHLGSAKVRLHELLPACQMRTPWLQLGVNKAEVLRC